MSITKVQINRATVGNLSGSRSFTSSSLASRVTTEATNVDNLQTDSGSFSTRVTDLVTASSSFSGSIATLRGAGSLQGVGTSDSPTFAGATITGTLTAQEVHTEFESASIIFSSGSTIFGDTSDDTHLVTGSMKISGSLTLNDGTLTVTDNVDFNSDLDVDGTTNLDAVDIDGAVDMASTLTLGGRLTLSNDGSDPGLFLGGGWQIFDNASESYGTAGDLVFFHGASRMVVGDTGLVGIGTTDPSGSLHISNTGTTVMYLEGDSNNSGQEDAYIKFVVDGQTQEAKVGWDNNNSSTLFNNNTENAFVVGCVSNLPVVFATNNKERMQILADGRVAIKASSLPQDFGAERGHLLVSSEDNAGANNYAVLQLQGHSINNDGSLGAIHFYDHNSSNASIQANRQNNNGSAQLFFSTSESGGSKSIRMTIRDDGKVGIGTTSVDNKVHVRFSDDSNVTAGNVQDDSVSGIKIENATTSNGAGSMLKFSNSSDGVVAAIAHTRQDSNSSFLDFFVEQSGTVHHSLRMNKTAQFFESQDGFGQVTIKAGHVLADNAQIDITPAGNVYSALILATEASSGKGAMFHHTYAGTMNELSDPSNHFTTLDNNDGTVNVHSSANTVNLSIENKIGSSAQVGFCMYGLESE